MFRILGIFATALSLAPVASAQPLGFVPARAGRPVTGPPLPSYGDPHVACDYAGHALGYYHGFYASPVDPAWYVGSAPSTARRGGPIALNPFNGLPYDAHVAGTPAIRPALQSRAASSPQLASAQAGQVSPPGPPTVPDEGPPTVPDEGPPTVPEPATAMLLKLVDVDDPVPVGSDVTFLAIVANQGDRPARDVRVTVRLPEGLRFVDASGPTEARPDGRAIAFGAVDSLAPGDELRWRLSARAEQPGQVSTRADLSADFLATAAVSVEPTTLLPALGDAEPVPDPVPIPPR